MKKLFYLLLVAIAVSCNAPVENTVTLTDTVYVEVENYSQMVRCWHYGYIAGGHNVYDYGRFNSDVYLRDSLAIDQYIINLEFPEGYEENFNQIKTYPIGYYGDDYYE